MKNAFILTQNKEHFDSLHLFLTSNGYINDQLWEAMKSNINILRSIDIKWPIPSHMLNEMSDDSFSKVTNMLIRNNLSMKKEFPGLFIIEDDHRSSVRLESEKFFACIQYVSYYLNSKNAKCSVIFLISKRRTEEVFLHSENEYIWLESSDLTDLELINKKFSNVINTFIDKKNPKTLSDWLGKNF